MQVRLEMPDEVIYLKLWFVLSYEWLATMQFREIHIK